MHDVTDRRIAARLFRERIDELVARSGGSMAEFARRSGLDRSTLSQLMNQGQDRLPRAETLVAIAVVNRVSLDWLLGLSPRERSSVDVLEEAVSLETGGSSPVDERLLQWFTEGAGYRVKTSPATFPDMLKTPAALEYQYRNAVGMDAQKSLANAQARLAFLRRPDQEFEACVSIQAIEDLAYGTGLWRDFPAEARREQLDQMSVRVRELYPSMRLFLYDQRRIQTAPFTVFGPHRAAIFLGGAHMVFTAPEHVRMLSRRFDDLIRAAEVDPSAAAGWIAGLDPKASNPRR